MSHENTTYTNNQEYILGHIEVNKNVILLCIPRENNYCNVCVTLMYIYQTADVGN